MAYLTKFLLLSLLISLSQSNAQTSSSKPKSLVLPVSKDSSTLQYLTRLSFGTPAVEKLLVVDLGGHDLWIACEDTKNKSSTYRQGLCGSAACSVAKAYCIPNKNTCDKVSTNTIFGTSHTSEISIDKISLIQSKKTPPFSIPNFIFGCTWSLALTRFATGAEGMLGFAREKISFPNQLSSSLGGSFRRKFAFCLPSTPNKNGVLFLGESSYRFFPGYNTSKPIDVSRRFKYIKLQTNYERTATPRIQGGQLPEYFVRITSILVNNKPVPINTTLLEFHKTGVGGSTITTVKPYTTFESSIYKSFVKAFDDEIIPISKVKKVGAIAPFSDCYSKGNLGMSLLGLGVPDISFVFENNKDLRWDIYGANSMVEINDEVVCLGILDGGSQEINFQTQRTYVDIGAHQLQDNLVEFDLAASRLGFTSTLLFDEIECSNFKF